jgi:hypothetical protein
MILAPRVIPGIISRQDAKNAKKKGDRRKETGGRKDMKN